MKHLATGLLSGFWIKFLGAVSFLFISIKFYCILIIALIIIDTITGIWKAFKQGEKITSRKMSVTISKILLYNLCIVSIFLFEHILGIYPDALYCTRTIVGYLSLTELKSIFENVDIITKVNLLKKLKEILTRPTDEVRDIILDEPENKDK